MDRGDFDIYRDVLFLFLEAHCLVSASGTHKDGEDMKWVEEIPKIAVDWKRREFPISGHLRNRSEMVTENVKQRT